MTRRLVVALAATLAMEPAMANSDVFDRVEHGYADEKSDFTAMLNYYKANYPRIEPGAEAPEAPSLPRATMPVLMFHGLDDQALLPGALNDTWEWLEKDLTLVTVPGAGHFVQQDAGDLVTKTMKWWLIRDAE